MALESSFLAAENSAIHRRSRALHRFIVASPVLLLIAVGLVGHLRKSPYRSPAGSPTYDANVLAYRERVAAAQDLHATEEAPSTAVVLQEAKRWVEGQKSGRLVAIPPAVYEDHLQGSVRGEILRTGLELSSVVDFRAERALAAHRFDEGVDEALTAAELAHGLRGFELQALLEALVVERRAIVLVAQTWPKLSTAQRESALPRLRAMLTDPSEVGRASLIERSQLTDYARRQAIPPPQIGTGRMRDEIFAAALRSVKTSNARIKSILAGNTASASAE